jgi:chemotaxis protein methyltransferase CheR
MISKTIEMPDIGIVQAKNIIRAIKQKYDYDFSHYTLTSFRFALDRSISRHHLKYPEMLASRILEDYDFFDEFLFEINDESLDLFRDPDTWILLKSKIFPEFFKIFNEPKIWIPGANNGQDLFSLLILLKIEFPGKKINLNISSVSEKTINLILSGKINPQIFKSGLENFEIIFPNADIHSFFKLNGKEYMLDDSLFHGISFTKQNLLFDPSPKSAGMIIYRNNLLNYNPQQQITIVERLVSILENDGYLITGIKENIEDYISMKLNLRLIDKHEKVYKKLNNP